MKNLHKISCVIMIAATLSACHIGAGPKSSADSLNRDSAIRDVTQSDTEKTDTNHIGKSAPNGDGHPRGGLD